MNYGTATGAPVVHSAWELYPEILVKLGRVRSGRRLHRMPRWGGGPNLPLGCLVPTAFGAVAAPALARSRVESRRFETARTMQAAVWVGLVPVAVVLAERRDLFALLFETEFTTAFAPAAILPATATVQAGMGRVARLLNMTGHERTAMWTLPGSAVAELAGNLMIIPRFGATEAVAVSSVTSVGAHVAMYLVARRRPGVVYLVARRRPGVVYLVARRRPGVVYLVARRRPGQSERHPDGLGRPGLRRLRPGGITSRVSAGPPMRGVGKPPSQRARLSRISINRSTSLGPSSPMAVLVARL